MAVTTAQHIPNRDSVPVSPSSGQFLFFRVTAKGPSARFQFASDDYLPVLAE